MSTMLQGFVPEKQLRDLLENEQKHPYNSRDDAITGDIAWKVVAEYFKEFNIIRHQTESFNHFCDSMIQQLIDSLPAIEARCDNMNSPHRYETHSIRFGKASLTKPHMIEQDSRKQIKVDQKTKSLIKDISSLTLITPKIARERKLTYSSRLYVECTHTVTIRKPSEQEKQVVRHYPTMGFGYIPIMVKCDYCALAGMDENELYAAGEDPYDPGGYLITNGVEKVMICQERMQNNEIFVFRKTTSGNKPVFEAEVRSLKEMSLRPASLTAMRYKTVGKGEGTAMIQVVAMPYLKQGQEIPVSIMFRALGILNDEEICLMISPEKDSEILNTLRPTLRELVDIKTPEDALEYIGKCTTNAERDREQKINYVRDLLTRDLFPHMGENYRAKAYYLGMMTQELLLVALGRKVPVERDHYARKRLLTAGELMGELLAQILQKMTKDIRGTLTKYLNEGRPIDVFSLIKEKAITQGLKYAISTGNWSANKIPGNRSNVTAVLMRQCLLSTLSHLRRLNTPVGRDAKLSKPRHLSGTHWGMICLYETPEGQSVGLVKNLSLMTHISLGDFSHHFHDVLYACGLKPLLECTCEEIKLWHKVLVNGCWMGMVQFPFPLVKEMQQLKASMCINEETGITYDYGSRSVRICTDAGRCMRAVFTAENGKLKITKERILKMEENTRDGFLQLQREGLVVYLDVEETEKSLIAMFPSDMMQTHGDNKRRKLNNMYTHCEIHPATILGIAAGTIPFPNHNPAARDTFYCAMGKQVVGVYLLNFNTRMDTMAHSLWYPQKPLVTTKGTELCGLGELPAGINVIVGVVSWSGYSQEDAIITNQGFIDRAGFRSTFWRMYTDEQKQLGNHHTEQFEKPERETVYGLRQGSYEKLDHDGIAQVGVAISSDDVLIGKTYRMVPQQGSKFTKRDHSMPNRSTEKGFVDRVMISTNADGFKFAKVRVRSTRTPEIGDKFSSRHGQKGTFGMIFSPEDMPFSPSTGMIPDFLISPHAFASRMTIGHLLESLYGKAASFTGRQVDGTAFETHVREDEVESVLHKVGYQRYGKEILCDGRTGEKMMCNIYMGPVYYERLKHLVSDKIHSRSRGPINILTRQPVEGRSRDGGLRFGEMERDCLISHGASGILHGRLMDLSDKYEVWVCEKCGMFAQRNEDTGNVFCRPCNSTMDIYCIKIPYACKLLFQELLSMNIAPRIILETMESGTGEYIFKNEGNPGKFESLIAEMRDLSVLKRENKCSSMDMS